MKKSRDAITIYHDNSENSEDDITAAVDLAIPATKVASPTVAVKLMPSNATTNAILSLKNNPFFHDKRKWDESFTAAEKKELTGNIVKAAKDNDGETYVTLQEEEYTLSNLSHEEDESQESDDVDSTINKKPGRKPMADEEPLSDSDQDPKVKRKAQNRAAQRAFRERKERYVKELESKLKQVQDSHIASASQLVRENHLLRSIIYRLESENYALKGSPMQPYQYQTTLPQHSPSHPPPSPSPSQTSQEQRHNGSYPTIAPLLPQQPLLPAYLSSSTSISNHPSANPMMMLASSPLQQYPMSPVVSLTNNSLSSPTIAKKIPLAISKKVSPKKTHTVHPSPPPPPPPTVNNQPLEYTFSISTPASLRPSGGVTSSKHTRSEPIELVQLHPPSGKRTESVPDDESGSIVSDHTSSTVNTTLGKNIKQLELDLFDCHIDTTEGQLFCEKLYNEVCNDAFNRLLSEPLFDQMGKLNLSISTYPVPIVTGHHKALDESSEEEETEEDSRQKSISLSPSPAPASSSAAASSAPTPSSPSPTEKRLLTCPEIWFLLNKHEKIHCFTTDQLCQAVKELAKCADKGPVLEEKDLYKIMSNMDRGFI
ncbi:hypothetical protein INT47_009887 [Mucor saturninus]|uniref:BZIP domain-containing protein n=1 Tax=Mucor saturninus TaxID=64648 RepID=A0A8H7V0T3_9FUNG|nr:hypothetical protein INT47_009887 [Mucor saturninus]